MSTVERRVVLTHDLSPDGPGVVMKSHEVPYGSCHRHNRHRSVLSQCDLQIQLVVFATHWVPWGTLYQYWYACLWGGFHCLVPVFGHTACLVIWYGRWVGDRKLNRSSPGAVAINKAILTINWLALRACVRLSDDMLWKPFSLSSAFLDKITCKSRGQRLGLYAISSFAMANFKSVCQTEFEIVSNIWPRQKVHILWIVSSVYTSRTDAGFAHPLNIYIGCRPPASIHIDELEGDFERGLLDPGNRIP